MILSKLTQCYRISVAEKSVLVTRNQVRLVKITSHLQQRSNRQILHSLEEFLKNLKNLEKF